MQHLIYEQGYNFRSRVNVFLLHGWRIVPGTIGAASLRRVGSVGYDKVTPAQEVFDHVCWCVVEKEESDEQA